MRTGTEACRVNRIILSFDREGSDEASQLMMLSSNLRDHRVMSVTSNLPPLQKVDSFPRFRISEF